MMAKVTIHFENNLNYYVLCILCTKDFIVVYGHVLKLSIRFTHSQDNFYSQ